MGIRADSTHTSGIKPTIPVIGALMILRGNHRHYRFSVGKRQHRHFRPGNKFLYYDLVARSSKNFVIP